MDTEAEVLEPSVEEEVVEEVTTETEEVSEEAEPVTEPEPRVVEEPQTEPVKEIPITETEEFKRLQSEADKRVADAEEARVRSHLESEWAKAQAYAEVERNRAQQAADQGQITQDQANAHKERFSEMAMRRDFSNWSQQVSQANQGRQTQLLEEQKQKEIATEHETMLRDINANKVAKEFPEIEGLMEKLTGDTELVSEKDMRAKAVETAYQDLKAKVRDGSIATEEYPKTTTSTTQTGASDDDQFIEDYGNGKAHDHERYQRLKNK